MGSVSLPSLARLALVLMVLAIVPPLTAAAVQDRAGGPQHPWLRAVHFTPAQRAHMLVGNMTVDEKVQLLHGTGWGTTNYVGFVTGIPRLGVPDLHLNDGPQGFRCNGLGKCPPGTSTCFPSGLTVAATWDVDSVRSWGTAMGREFWNKGATVQLGPGLCLARVPNNGRNFEYLSGEDPFLGFTLSRQAVEGIQSQTVVANAKHYILNNQETNRNTISAVVDERTLLEMYEPPFQGAVDGKVGSVMCSYNQINGVYSCSNNQTLNTDLKQRLGFEGWVMSDWRATHNIAIVTGQDQEMPGDTYYGQSLKDAVESGGIPQATLDGSVMRVLTPLFEVGWFDKPNNNSIDTNVSTAESIAVAQNLSESATVLLKNRNNILPLDASKIKKIAVFGQDAVTPTVGGGGSGMVNPSYLPAPLDAIARALLARAPKANNNCSEAQWENDIDYLHTDQLGQAQGTGPADCCNQCTNIVGCNYFSFKKSASTCYFKVTNVGRTPNKDVVSGGCHKTLPPMVVYHADATSAQAQSDAKTADVAIVFVSSTSSEGSDRPTLAYSSDLNTLVTTVAGLQANTVVAAVSPGAVLLPWDEQVAAILLAFFPGQAYAPALANLLFGVTSPSGKLPITIPNKDNEIGFTPSQYPGVDGVSNYTEGLFVGYRWYDEHQVTPKYPFGHGLSYTSYEYSKLSVSGMNVSFEVSNSGARSGAEVVQLYLGFPKTSASPPQQLKGFHKVVLKAGESRQVSFTLQARDVSVWDVASHSWQVPAGTFEVFVGSSSRDIRLKGQLTPSGMAEAHHK